MVSVTAIRHTSDTHVELQRANDLLPHPAGDLAEVHVARDGVAADVDSDVAGSPGRGAVRDDPTVHVRDENLRAALPDDVGRPTHDRATVRLAGQVRDQVLERATDAAHRLAERRLHAVPGIDDVLDLLQDARERSVDRVPDGVEYPGRRVLHVLPNAPDVVAQVAPGDDRRWQPLLVHLDDDGHERLADLQLDAGQLALQLAHGVVELRRLRGGLLVHDETELAGLVFEIIHARSGLLEKRNQLIAGPAEYVHGPGAPLGGVLDAVYCRPECHEAILRGHGLEILYREVEAPEQRFGGV